MNSDVQDRGRRLRRTSATSLYSGSAHHHHHPASAAAAPPPRGANPRPAAAGRGRRTAPRVESPPMCGWVTDAPSLTPPHRGVGALSPLPPGGDWADSDPLSVLELRLENHLARLDALLGDHLQAAMDEGRRLCASGTDAHTAALQDIQEAVREKDTRTEMIIALQEQELQQKDDELAESLQRAAALQAEAEALTRELLGKRDEVQFLLSRHNGLQEDVLRQTERGDALEKALRTQADEAGCLRRRADQQGEQLALSSSKLREHVANHTRLQERTAHLLRLLRDDADAQERLRCDNAALTELASTQAHQLEACGKEISRKNAVAERLQEEVRSLSCSPARGASVSPGGASPEPLARLQHEARTLETLNELQISQLEACGREIAQRIAEEKRLRERVRELERTPRSAPAAAAWQPLPEGGGTVRKALQMDSADEAYGGGGGGAAGGSAKGWVGGEPRPSPAEACDFFGARQKGQGEPDTLDEVLERCASRALSPTLTSSVKSAQGDSRLDTSLDHTLTPGAAAASAPRPSPGPTPDALEKIRLLKQINEVHLQQIEEAVREIGALRTELHEAEQQVAELSAEREELLNIIEDVALDANPPCGSSGGSEGDGDADTECGGESVADTPVVFGTPIRLDLSEAVDRSRTHITRLSEENRELRVRLAVGGTTPPRSEAGGVPAEVQATPAAITQGVNTTPSADLHAAHAAEVALLRSEAASAAEQASLAEAAAATAETRADEAADALQALQRENTDLRRLVAELSEKADDHDTVDLAPLYQKLVEANNEVGVLRIDNEALRAEVERLSALKTPPEEPEPEVAGVTELRDCEAMTDEAEPLNESLIAVLTEEVRHLRTASESPSRQPEGDAVPEADALRTQVERAEAERDAFEEECASLRQKVQALQDTPQQAGVNLLRVEHSRVSRELAGLKQVNRQLMDKVESLQAALAKKRRSISLRRSTSRTPGAQEELDRVAAMYAEAEYLLRQAASVYEQCRIGQGISTAALTSAMRGWHGAYCSHLQRLSGAAPPSPRAAPPLPEPPASPSGDLSPLSPGLLSPSELRQVAAGGIGTPDVAPPAPEVGQYPSAAVRAVSPSLSL